ncbi:MAG: type transport system permease protein [Patescibacteria group bacterium]|nr:type transport system permease protein [Patescibacteria group bacterium]
MKTIYILWLRQLKKYFRSKQRMFASLAQPLLFLFAFGYGFGSVFAKAGDGNYITFLAPGIIAMTVMFTSVFSGIEIISDKQFGFLKETLVAPVSRFNIMLGRTLGGATVACIQGVIIFLITLVAGFHPAVSGLYMAFVFMFMLALFFTAFGTAIASKLDDMQGFPLIINFLVMPLFFLSGALFPVTGLPKVFGMLVRLNPLSYAVDGIRGSLSGVHAFSLSFDFVILAVFAFLFLYIGAELFKRIQA